MHAPAMTATGPAPASLEAYGSYSEPRCQRPWGGSAPGGASVVREAGRAKRENPTTRSPAPERVGDRARQAMRLRNLSLSTEKAYLGWMLRYYEYHDRRNPLQLGAPAVTAFLNALATERHVAASTQNQALAALLFLYREVLGQDLPWLDDLVRARTAARLPVVLSRDEVRAVLSHMQGTPHLMGLILYGSGLRLMECCRLTGPGHRLRAQPDHRAARQRRPRPRHGAAGCRPDRAERAPGPRAPPAPARRGARGRLGRVAPLPGDETTCGGPGVALAMGLPGQALLPACRERPAAAAPPPRDCPPARRAPGCSCVGHLQEGNLPHLSLLCRLPDYAALAPSLSEGGPVSTRHNQRTSRKGRSTSQDRSRVDFGTRTQPAECPRPNDRRGLEELTKHLSPPLRVKGNGGKESLIMPRLQPCGGVSG